MSVMEYNNYGAYNAYQAYPSYTGYTSQPNHFNLKVGTNSARGAESNQEIVEFLAELIRSWWGIIKSLLSSLEWIFGYWSPLPSLPSLSPLQDEYREKFTNLTKFGSKRANFGLVPSTNRSWAPGKKFPIPSAIAALYLQSHRLFVSGETKADWLEGNFTEIFW